MRQWSIVLTTITASGTAFLVALCRKLDGADDVSYTAIIAPLIAGVVVVAPVVMGTCKVE